MAATLRERLSAVTPPGARAVGRGVREGCPIRGPPSPWFMIRRPNSSWLCLDSRVRTRSHASRSGGARACSAVPCPRAQPQVHLRAEPGDCAPLVLLPGDPNRATKIASRFDGGLEGTRRVTEHRALYGFTGTWQGRPVSVQATGMGTPSLAIVVEELLRLGATRLIRVGPCPGFRSWNSREYLWAGSGQREG